MKQPAGMQMDGLNMGRLTTSHVSNSACGGTYLNDAQLWKSDLCAQGTAE